MKIEEIDKLFAHYYELIGYHQSTQKIETVFPELSVKSLYELYRSSYVEGGKNLIFHVFSLLERADIIGKSRGVRNNDLIETYIAIYYHDCAKVLSEVASKNILLSQVLKIEEGHSISAQRLFLYVDEPLMAHHVRHNSSDLAFDMANNNVTIPQLLLNLVDKTDESGRTLSIWDKYEKIKAKIGSSPLFDDYSEKIVCTYLDRVLKEDSSLYDYEFTTQENPKFSCIFIQRWDGKYCKPVGKYQHTNSNLYISKYASKWGMNTTILNEGNFKSVVQDGKTQILGIPEEMLDLALPLYCLKKDLIIVEGSTSRVAALRKTIGSSSSLVLLLRTLVLGEMGPDRLKSACEADEIWVMTQQMKDTIDQEFKKYNLRPKAVRLLQSGVDEEVFNVNDNIERIPGKITYVGALTKIKGVDMLIEAFSRIKSEFPHATLHLIGDQAIYGRVNEFIPIEELNKIPGLVLHGSLLADQIAPHLQSAHVSCLLTTVFETFGKSALQARCCGAQMLVSGFGNNPFHVQTKEEGIVLKELNVDTIYKGLKEILSREPMTSPPPEGRYHPWKVTALDFMTNFNFINRKVLPGNIDNLKQGTK